MRRVRGERRGGVERETRKEKRGYCLGYLLSQSPPERKPLPRVRKPNLYSDRGQDSNPCAWRPLGPQSTHGSTVKESSFL
ncbi:hypothetical protein E2C01_037330 [Portunus trituberculatus]|uniref:Uncharacterized protein n=1 Tax=Portunus trituberculatus TaxID=210409 RepID=A0A5B7FDQ3_PORTR|nr:hypothetical protein [Portunus trituberculatus]